MKTVETPKASYKLTRTTLPRVTLDRAYGSVRSQGSSKYQMARLVCGHHIESNATERRHRQANCLDCGMAGTFRYDLLKRD